ncbi:hypothetical protein AURDEDRAFT_129708 [Auricularia subglabra TFB-10046 SS5]|nr:hypothetical protein AURDEDRAFT_129708 [Auricularia subglabra TFB-10046 SS5]
MSRKAFEHLLDIIQDNPVFKSKGQKPQTPTCIQLATFLAKYGGDNSLQAATVAGVSEGSAYNFCERVITAVRNLRDQFVHWPDAEERESIKTAMADYGIPGCTGLVDGSLIRLVDKPIRNPYAYWTRKKFYGIALQTVCKHHGRFTEYETGWPGSVADTTLLKESHMWKNKP